jgi:hypothetical protein
MTSQTHLKPDKKYEAPDVRWIPMSNEATAQQWAAVPSADFSCNINGIPLQTRAHYHQLVAALIRAIDEKRELPDGYAFRIKTERITAEQLVEWVNLEKQCCPFFGVPDPLGTQERTFVAPPDRTSRG